MKLEMEFEIELVMDPLGHKMQRSRAVKRSLECHRRHIE
jgi:hypothetical protein